MTNTAKERPITRFTDIFNKKYENFVLEQLEARLFSIPCSIAKELELMKEFGSKHAELIGLVERLELSGESFGDIWAVSINKYCFLLGNYQTKTVRKVKMPEMLHALEKTIRVLSAKGDLDGMKALICFIHNNIPYFTTRSDLFVEYYRLEAYNACISQLEYKYSLSDAEHSIAKSNKAKLDEIIDRLTKNTTKTVRVWLLRELYYMLNPLCSYLEPEDQLKALTYLIDGNSKSFFSMFDKERQRSFGCTNPLIYFGVHKAFNQALCLPKAARFNALLNVAHCNGTMSSKFIQLSKNEYAHGSENDFLNRLSDGEYTKDIPLMVARDLGISPLLVI